MTATADPSGEAASDAPTPAPPDWRLTPPERRLAVAECVVDGLNLQATQDRLWREDPLDVAAAHGAARVSRSGQALGLDDAENIGRKSKRRAHGALPRRDRTGLTLQEIAQRTGLAHATLTALLEHHGFLECVPYGGRSAAAS